MNLKKVCTVSEISEGAGKVIEIDGKLIAIFKCDGQFFATENTCPHAGGPLGEGTCEDGVISCPWHGWRFDVKTGVSPVNPAAKIGTFKVQVKGNDVFVEV